MEKLAIPAQFADNGSTRGDEMSRERVCVMCAKGLEPAGRCDRRYCSRLCRLHAFRARQKQGVPQGPRAARTSPSPTYRPSKLLDVTRSQLDLFRELRQARRRIAELAAQSAQTQKASEQQRREQEQARQAFEESARADRAERAQLESKLADAAAQQEQDAKAIEAGATELRRAQERISELTEELSRASTSSQRTLAQLHDLEAESSKQILAGEKARDAAQRQAQIYQEAAAKADDERETLRKWALDQLAGLWTSRNSEREEHAQKLAEMQKQLEATQEQAAALQAKLERAERTVREQRDQLDDTALALSEARAVADPAVIAAKITQAQAAAAEAQKKQAAWSEKLRAADQECVDKTQSLSKAQERTKELETEIAKLKDAAVEADREHGRQFNGLLQANDLLRKQNDELRARRRFF